MAFDLPEPLVQVPAEQLGLRRVIHFDGPDSAAPPAGSHFDFTGRPDIAHPLGGAARRHQIVEVVDGQHVDHHAAKPACFATAHPKSPGPGDADPDLGQPADQRVGGLGRGVGLVVTHRHVASFREVKLESTALVTNDHDTPGTENKSTVLSRDKIGRWRNVATHVTASKLRSSSWADAIWWSMVRPGCRCAPSPATWEWCRRRCTDTSPAATSC